MTDQYLCIISRAKAIESGRENCFEFANEQEQEELFGAMNRVKCLQQDRISSLLARERAKGGGGGGVDKDVTVSAGVYE